LQEDAMHMQVTFTRYYPINEQLVLLLS